MNEPDFTNLVIRLAEGEAKRVHGYNEIGCKICEVLIPILINLDLNFPEAFKSVIERMEKKHAGL